MTNAILLVETGNYFKSFILTNVRLRTWYFHSLGTKLDQIDLFILLDLIGPSDTRFGSLNSETYDWYQSMRDIEIRLNGQEVCFSRDKTVNDYIEDDHMDFKEKG